MIRFVVKNEERKNLSVLYIGWDLAERKRRELVETEGMKNLRVHEVQTVWIAVSKGIPVRVFLSNMAGLDWLGKMLEGEAPEVFLMEREIE